MFDIILRNIRNSNIYMDGVLIIFSIDHIQIHPIEGHPFLTSCHIISCFKMSALKNYVRASNYYIFKYINQIARFSYQRLVDESNLVGELKFCVEKT